MKPIYLVSAALSLSLLACAQDIPASKVPSVVLNTVKAKYAQGNNIEWEKKQNYYEAEFNIDSVEHCLHIDALGNLLEHKWDIKLAALPQTISSAIEAAYPGYSIDDAAIIDKNGQQTYELELEGKGKKELKVYFDAKGQLINKN
jgi:uncharacterized membrane protein YkoI